MKPTPLMCLFLAAIVFPLFAGDFSGENGTIPEGWHFFKLNSKQYYIGPYKWKDDKTGLVDNGKDGKMMKLTTPDGEETWRFDKHGIECKSPGILEIVLCGKSEKGTATAKAAANNLGWKPIVFGEDWTEQRIYLAITKPQEARLSIELPKGKTLYLKSCSAEMLPLDENRECEFLGNSGDFPALWRKTPWAKDADFSGCGITQETSDAPGKQSFKLSGTAPLAIERFSPETLKLGKAGVEMEFSVWMKGKAPKGVKLMLLDDKWKWVNKEMAKLDNTWKQYTVRGTVPQEVAGNSYHVVIEMQDGDILIGKYYIGVARKEKK